MPETLLVYTNIYSYELDGNHSHCLQPKRDAVGRTNGRSARKEGPIGFELAVSGTLLPWMIARSLRMLALLCF